MKKNRILIVEDEHALAAAIATVCGRIGAEPVLASSGGRALKALRDESGGDFQLVILDIGLPDMSGLELLRTAFGENVRPLPVPVVVITAHGNLENAIAAQQLGVTEYLLKPLDLHEFQSLLERVLESGAPEPVQEKVREHETTMIGAAPAMQQVFRDIAHACATSAPVVISGRTGTGKSLAARLIHSNGKAGERLITVIDCESVRVLPTVSGTLIFENVDALASGVQADLLRLIESSPPDVRVIATTRVNLRDIVNSGEFRDDLYYRLHVLEVRLPSLGERRGDIPALAAYFLGKAESVRALSISPEAMAALTRYEWPGNVLELRNALEYAVSLCGGSNVLPQHLPAGVTLGRHLRAEAGADIETARLRRSLAEWLDVRLGDGDANYADILTEIESLLLSDLLLRYDNRPTRLAEALKMNRTTLRKKCENLTVKNKKTPSQ